nr:zinc finger protein 84-like [Lytechinus pictus]
MTESTGTECSHCKKIDGTSIKEERIDGGDTARGGNNGSCECEMTESALTVCSHSCGSWRNKEERGDRALGGNSGSCECEMIESTGIECSHCKKKLELTVKYATGLLQCFFCDCSFSEENQLMKHLQNHVGILNSDTYQCSTCKESFLSNSDLAKHVGMCCEKNSDECIQNTISLATIDDDKIRSENTGDLERRFPCSDCNEIFSSKKHLARHLYGEKLQDDEAEFSQRPFLCSSCGRRFPSECGLVNHKRKHESRSYECFYCSKSFLSSKERQRHEGEHGSKNPLECQYCRKTFSKRDGLTQHIKNSHK